MSFKSVMQTINADVKIGFQTVEHYALPIESLIAAIDPKAAPIIAGVNAGISLIQHGVILVEQKYAALGNSAKTGPAKAADVVALTQGAVQQLIPGLEPDGVKAIIDAVVAILNVPGIAAAATTPASAN